MAKFVVSLELDKKNVAEKCEFGDVVHEHMDGNSNFGTPNPSLGDLEAATAALRTAAENAANGGVLLTAIMREKESEWDVIMTAMGNYVDSIARGSETIIRSAGMDVKKESAPLGTPAQVTGLNAGHGKSPGEVALSYDRPAGTLVFLVFMKAEGETDDQYKLVASPSSKKVVIGGLTPAQWYWFKVQAVGTKNRVGALSDPATTQAAL